MTNIIFYPIRKTTTFRNGEVRYAINYENATVHVTYSDDEFIIAEFGNVMNPVFDSRNDILIGFVDA